LFGFVLLRFRARVIAAIIWVKWSRTFQKVSIFERLLGPILVFFPNFGIFVHWQSSFLRLLNEIICVIEWDWELSERSSIIREKKRRSSRRA
jgi:hypothetical protein